MASDVGSPNEAVSRRAKAWGGLGLIVMVLALSSLFIFAAKNSPTGWLRAGCAALLVAVAPLALGALIGFLFGIPRILQGDSPARQEKAAGQQAGDSDQAPERIRYLANTNLDQISDWLSKIIVGVGLTEFREIPPRLWKIAERIRPVLGGDDMAQTVAALAIVFFLVAGFFLGYLVTRLVLTSALRVADDEANRPDQEIVGRALDAIIESGPQGNLLKPQVALSKADAAELLKFKLDDLKDIDDMRAWAKAQLKQGNFSDARTALARAVEASSSESSELRREYAAALSANQNFGEARTELEKALETASKGGDENERARLVEGLVLNSLYDKPPEGFLRAIEYMRDYMASPGGRATSSLAAWLGCALGQKYAWEKSQGKLAEPELLKIRNDALEAVRRAVAADPKWKPVLASSLRSTTPGGDDDLAVFADDKDFQDVLLK
jgi:tetratricopeptide (TPR) repeat protein